MQIGIDLGGTKIEAIALAAETVVAPRRRLAAPRDYGGTLDAIARLVAELEAETGRTGTVLACSLQLLGRTADDAIAAVHIHRPHWPESPWQEQVVRSGPG